MGFFSELVAARERRMCEEDEEAIQVVANALLRGDRQALMAAVAEHARELRLPAGVKGGWNSPLHTTIVVGGARYLASHDEAAAVLSLLGQIKDPHGSGPALVRKCTADAGRLLAVITYHQAARRG